MAPDQDAGDLADRVEVTLSREEWIIVLNSLANNALRRRIEANENDWIGPDEKQMMRDVALRIDAIEDQIRKIALA